MSDYFQVILWFIFIEVVGLLSVPIARALAGQLKDCGHSTARALGLVLITYLSWLFSYLFSFTKSTILLAVLVLASGSTLLYRKNRKGFPARKVLIANELVFAAGFLYFLFVRMHLPEISGGEKFMDFAFLNAVLRTSSFPPADPWFAGGALDFYYYFGYLFVGVPGKLCSVAPAELFNLALALIFALTLSLSFGLGYNLTGRIKYGALAAVFVALLGNLRGVAEFVSLYILEKTAARGYYWSSSRVIPYTINEFPYFSFIQGDLHSHMIAIPVQLLLIAFLLNVYFRKTESWVFENLPAFLAFSICLGFLFPANSWDFPVYVGLTVAVFFVFYAGRQRSGRSYSSLLFGFLKTTAFVVLFSAFLYLPYYLSFSPMSVSGLGTVGPELRTQVWQFLVLFGFFLFLIFSFLFSCLEFKQKLGFKQKAWCGVFLVGVLVLLARDFSLPLLPVLLPLLALSGYSLLKDLPERSSLGFVSLLSAAAALIALICELFYLDDPYSGPYVRINTVFKFYMHVWTFLAIAALYSYSEVRSQKVGPLFKGRKMAWNIVFLLLFFSCAVYPVVATVTRAQESQAGPTLDGMNYINGFYPGDYDALQWLLENVKGTPIILETCREQSSYSYISRVSANTGLPTVLGWAGHERFWGRDPNEIKTRLKDIDYIYRTTSTRNALELINKYNITYVYVGLLEQQEYNDGLKKFDDPVYFELVYLDSVRIYKVKSAA